MWQLHGQLHSYCSRCTLHGDEVQHLYLPAALHERRRCLARCACVLGADVHLLDRLSRGCSLGAQSPFAAETAC